MAHKILIVDDDRLNIALVKFGLAEKGYDVRLAGDGDEGLDKVREDCPDLIVLDVQMPNMNGFEFVNELKRLQDDTMTPVIMLTANETLQDVFALEGVKGYFVKPVHMPDLVLKIVETIGPNPV